MKNLGIIGFAMAALVLVGCSSNKSGSMGAVNSSESCSAKSQCCEGQKKDAAMGAVGEKKSGCCSEAKKDAAMGAVSEKKEGSCASSCGSKTDCSSKKSN
jgi:hypothetical protein